jgi:hypothetical protein
MPSASIRDSGTAGSPAAREARRRGLNVSEMIADSLGERTKRTRGAPRGARARSMPLRSAAEVSRRLVGLPAFKAGGTGDPRPAGSIPVHLRDGDARGNGHPPWTRASSLPSAHIVGIPRAPAGGMTPAVCVEQRGGVEGGTCPSNRGRNRLPSGGARAAERSCTPRTRTLLLPGACVAAEWSKPSATASSAPPDARCDAPPRGRGSRCGRRAPSGGSRRGRSRPRRALLRGQSRPLVWGSGPPLRTPR